MSRYPKDFRTDEFHMLFDIGYSYALLERAKHALQILGEDFTECADLVRDIDEFTAGRLDITKEIYDAANRLAEKEGK